MAQTSGAARAQPPGAPSTSSAVLHGASRTAENEGPAAARAPPPGSIHVVEKLPEPDAPPPLGALRAAEALIMACASGNADDVAAALTALRLEVAVATMLAADQPSRFDGQGGDGGGKASLDHSSCSLRGGSSADGTVERVGIGGVSVGNGDGADWCILSPSAHRMLASAVNICDTHGATPLLHVLTRRLPANGAATALLAAGADASPSVALTASRNTALHLAAYGGDAAAVKLLVRT
eukprot:360078-Chlamydomonas_euryale.AAC.10